MNTLFVTVVLTTYNRKSLLYDAVKSVLKQNYLNFELIIINDGGEDVWEIIESFNSDKIKLLTHYKNFGQSFARNTALKESQGDIIFYLDDDDLFLEHHLEVHINLYKQHNIDVVYTDAMLVTECIERDKRNVLSQKKMFDLNDYSYQKLQIQNFIPINTLSHRKNILSKVGFFDEGLSSLEDWELLLRLGEYAKFHHIPSSTVEVRRNICGSSNISSREQINAPKMYNKIYKLHKVNNNSYVLIQRSLVILRIIKDNLRIKKNLFFTILQLYPILKEIIKFIYYFLFTITIIKKKKQ